jgi:hypothetical protein
MSLDSSVYQARKHKADMAIQKSSIRKLEKKLDSAKTNPGQTRSRNDDSDIDADHDGPPTSDLPIAYRTCDESLEVVDVSFSSDPVYASTARPVRYF